MGSFTIFPAIDLRRGQVVRLQEGDPSHQTVYSSDPGEIADRWLAAEAEWLHVVNLDGAFDQPDQANRQALTRILVSVAMRKASLQFGGGLRSIAAVEDALSSGITRGVLGTLAAERPDLVASLIERWGSERIAVSLDARDGIVQVHGWQEGSGLAAVDAARHLAEIGLRWLIYTDIGRDGLQKGLNLEHTCKVAAVTGLQVIASGGVAGPQDIRDARSAGLAGVIVGKALYDGQIDLQQILAESGC